MGSSTTLDQIEPESESPGDPVAGLVGVFCVDEPVCHPRPFDGAALELGRGDDGAFPDDRVASRRHARVARRGDRWMVTDLGSRNGTFVNGARISGDVPFPAPRIVRVGHTIFLGLDDVRPHRRGVAIGDEGVIGPVLGDVLAKIRRLSATTDTLLVTGESGAGKELAARSFHKDGPFLAVNCATIPEGVAERLLFGSVRGAFSGATDAKGYVEAADGGVLFLDEVAELDPSVQAKLLRVLEAREVLPLGATKPRPVTTRICFATLTNLRAAMSDGRFRADLFFRIARAHVQIPPLRERREEIPYLVAWELRRLDATLTAHADFIEACLLRDWPGNLRELLSAVRRAGETSREAGAEAVRASHLDKEAGTSGHADDPPEPAAQAHPDDVGEDAIRAAIAQHRGNLSAVARALKLHRSQLYRLLKKYGIEGGA